MNTSSISAKLKAELIARGIKDTPAFPLALNVKMPETHELDNANLTFRFYDFYCSSSGAIQVAPSESDHSGYRKMKISIEQIDIVGRYAIEAIEVPAIDLDLGGTLMPFNSEFNKPRPAGANEGTGVFNDQQKDEYLDQAREQRTRLMDTPNGQQLMGVYDAHEEVYTEMFESSNSVRRTWQQGNVTADMASHTSDAIKQDATINPSPNEKKFGQGFFRLGYNNNALIQQISLATACMAAAKQTESLPNDSDIPDNKYGQAALAASNFKEAVATTGNTQNDTTPMTASEVYTSVNDHSGDVPQMTIAELNNMQSQSMGPGGGAAAIAEAKEKGWYVLSEAERTQMRSMMDRCYAEFCALDERKPLPLWEGTCSTSICGTEIFVLFSEDTSEVIVEQVELPVFDFELDDSQWQEEAAEIARKRLSQIHFVRSLLHTQISKSLELATLRACQIS
ncbi:hypothetical protein [Moorena producens]|uniref:hypothetical protein n=1 Tax=Moorena producens TaxID=1155739 RepID=UPI003C7445CF